MKWVWAPLAAMILATGCGKPAANNVPIYGSHFAEDAWLPAEGISQRGPIKRTRAATIGSQTVFDQAFDYTGNNSGSECQLSDSVSSIQVGQSTTLTLALTSPATYLAQFASTWNSFQVTGIGTAAASSTGNTFTLTGYFNQPGPVSVIVAAGNAPFTSLNTCEDTFSVVAAAPNNSGPSWTPWFFQPNLPNWAPGNYGSTNINGNGNTVNNTVNNTTVNNYTPPPAPPVPVAPSAIPLYRSHLVKSLGSGATYADFLYSQNPVEGTGLYTLDGIAFSAMPVAYGDFQLPLYRCLVLATNSLPYHFLSTDATCEGQKMEGAIGWVSATAITGTVPIYRLFQASTGAHITSKDQNEIHIALSNGYVMEGPQGFVF